jgi:hypothetical protein
MGYAGSMLNTFYWIGRERKLDNQSEVARLLAQIDDEYKAAQAGLTGPSLGVGQHAFITARMENMGRLGTALEELVGHSQAWQLIVSHIDASQPQN